MDRFKAKSAILGLMASALFALSAPAAIAQQLPPSPAPVAVGLDASTTAVLVLDVNQGVCAANPTCTGSVVPAIVPLLATAREAGALVVFSSGATALPILSDVGPEPGEQVLTSVGQDRFFSTAMDDILRARHITTVIVVGWKINGSVLYTSFGAGARRYTVVVPVDATSASTEAEIAVGRFQLLDQLGGNATNQPLAAGRVTLSRTDLISFE